MKALLEAHDLGRVLPATVPVTLVENIDLTIGDNEFVAITGPSGSGKSSLLYLLGLLDQPSHGSLHIDGHDTAKLKEPERAALRLESIGFVFQFHFLLPEFSVRANVELPMRKLARLSASQRRVRAEELLGSLGLADHLDKLPEQLSGGQRQRVAVARSLANDPPLLFADEPTGSLDTQSSEQVFSILSELVHQRGKTVVAVTHDLEMAERADRRVHLIDGQLTDHNEHQPDS